MTAEQLTLGDCDPAWDLLAQLGAEELQDPVDREWRDLRGQISKRDYYRITTIHLHGSYL